MSQNIGCISHFHLSGGAHLKKERGGPFKTTWNVIGWSIRSTKHNILRVCHRQNRFVSTRFLLFLQRTPPKPSCFHYNSAPSIATPSSASQDTDWSCHITIMAESKSDGRLFKRTFSISHLKSKQLRKVKIIRFCVVHSRRRTHKQTTRGEQSSSINALRPNYKAIKAL